MTPRTKTIALACLVILVVLASRLPFLGAGYGVNVDAWRVARTARNIALTGQYEASRLPGYPVHEIVSSWLWRGGPRALNGASALLSLGAVAAFAAFSTAIGLRDRILATLAFAMTPVVYISSVTSKDYVWALGFAMAGLLASFRGRALLAGVALGVAVGCRITSLGMLFPAILLLLGSRPRERRWRDLATLVLSSGVTSAIVFAPVLGRYGAGFFTFYDSHARPNWETIAGRATIEVWGTLGVIGLLVAIAAFVVQLIKREPVTALMRQGQPKRFVVSAVAAIILIYFGAYLRLPDQAGYLLPVVPAIVLLLGLYVPRIAFRVCCLCLIVAPFFDPWGPEHWAGPILTDHRERIRTIESITNFVQFSRTLPGRNVILVGGWEPQIDVLFPDRDRGQTVYRYLISEREMKEALAAGYSIYYLPAIRSFNASVHGFDVAALGARDLREIYEQRMRDRRHD